MKCTDADVKELMDTTRSHGVRLKNAEKNIGKVHFVSVYMCCIIADQVLYRRRSLLLTLFSDNFCRKSTLRRFALLGRYNRKAQYLLLLLDGHCCQLVTAIHSYYKCRSSLDQGQRKCVVLLTVVVVTYYSYLKQFINHLTIINPVSCLILLSFFGISSLFVLSFSHSTILL